MRQVLFAEHVSHPVIEQFKQVVLFELNTNPSLHETQVALFSQTEHPAILHEIQVPTELICSLLKHVLQ